MDIRLNIYFDKMAEIIRKLTKNSKLKYSSINNILCDPNCNYNVEFSNLFFPSFGNELNNVQLRLVDLNENFFDKVDDIIYKEDNNFYAMLLYYMDRWIHDCYITSVNFADDCEIYEGLNDNLEQTNIAILPRTKCNWDIKRIGNRWEQLLDNFYFVNYNKLFGMKVKNYEINSNIIFDRNQKSLKVAISPLTQDKVVKFSEPYTRIDEENGATQNLFRVEGVEDELNLLELVIDNIFIAGEKGVNILVFPEMLGTEEMLKKILHTLQEESERAIPPLIVFPSIWKKSENDSVNTNTSCLIVDGDEILFEQHKRCSFKYNKGGIDIYEDITHDSKYNVVHMLHINEIGRICIIICYDYLDVDNRACIMENLFPTLVCSPSFSTGSFNFNIISEKYFDQGCNWIWCNTCSAINETANVVNFDVIGVITTLSKQCKQTDTENFKKIFKGVNQCNKVDCMNCLYYAEIPLRFIKSEYAR